MAPDAEVALECAQQLWNKNLKIRGLRHYSRYITGNTKLSDDIRHTSS